MKSGRFTKTKLLAILALAIGLSVICFVEYLGLFTGINNHIYDLAFRIRGPRHPSDSIVIAAIDEKSLARLGRWPLDRRYYAELLEKAEQARAIGFDLILAEPSESDPVLRMAIQRHGRVIVPAHIESSRGIRYPAFPLSAGRLGHVHVEQDIDGIARNVFHTLMIKDHSLSSFADAMQQTVTGRPQIPVSHQYLRSLPEGEIQQSSMMKINYYGPPGTFQQISLADIIDGRFPVSFFQDKLVLVGVTAAGLEERILTPFTDQRDGMPGVEVHANILNNLLSGNDLRDAGSLTRRLTAFLLCFVLLFLLLFHKPGGVKPVVWWLLCMLAITSAVMMLLFTDIHLWYAPSLLYFSVTFTFVVGYMYRLEDIKDKLLQSTEDWEDTFGTIDDAIVILDRSCGLIRLNTAAQRSYEADFFRPFCLAFMRRCEQVVEGSGEGRVRGQRLREESATEEIFDPGADRYLELRSLPRFDEHDDLAGMILVIRDINGKKKAEAEQKKMQAQLLQSQKMEAIGHLAGGIAHDFNNMLTAIIGYGSLLGMAVDRDSELRPYIDQIMSSAEKSAGLTRQLLAFSRKQPLAPRETNLNDLIRGIEKLLGRIIGEDIELKTHMTGQEVHVMADPGQVEQVLMNLCANARDAMPNGGLLSISTETLHLDEAAAKTRDLTIPGIYVLISVTDTGSGMDEQTRQKIFEPFFTTKEPGKGTGLGLSIVYGVIKQHNGSIMVYSEPDKGTTFRIYLPVLATTTVEAVQVEMAVPVGGTETILIAEDSEEVRRLTKRMLEGFGYTVIEAVDGEDCLRKFAASGEDIQLVILDVIMPRMSGKEAGDEIRRINPQMKILYTSGYTADIVARKGILEEGTDFISKPATPHDLLSRVRTILDTKTGP